MNGKDFNEKFGKTKFYKMTHDIQIYQTGLNSLYSKLNQHHYDIYFIELQYALQSIEDVYYDWIIRQVTIPNDATVTIEPYESGTQRFRTNKIVLSEPLNFDSFFGLDTDKITVSDCFVAVLSNGYKLKFIPKHLRTYELCSAAVNTTSIALKFVPDEFRTHEICLAAISQFGMALEHVPNKLITEEFCWIASSKICILSYIPKQFRSLDICLKNIDRITNSDFQHVPDELKAEVIRLKTEEH